MTEAVPATEAEWRRLVERALDGKPFDSLISTTFEGLTIAPLYQRPAAEASHAPRQKPGAWAISQRMDHPEIATANAMARADLEGGADALTLTIFGAHTARGFGVRIEDARDLDAALAGIDLDRIALRLDAGARALELASSFVSLAGNRRLTSAALDVDFGHDPIGQFARSGLLPNDPAEGLRETHARLRAAGFTGHLLLADGRIFHEAGAGEAQELACVIATAVAYLRMLEQEGLTLDEARGDIALLLAADADEFLSLAKFRALRRLWSRVESACGLAPKTVRLHAETAFRMMTRYDPWVNILRATMAAFSAGAGGADVITILPFTLALGLPDELARRLARNTQSILIQESNLAKVADPAAGAGSFEALTDAFCAEAWRLFQSFEAQGGMLKSLQDGVPQRAIEAVAAARRAAIAKGRFAITGTSAFPFLAEAPVPVLAPCPAADQESPGAQDTIALPSRRDAEPYERLRVASDARFHKTGERPKIFLVNLGEPQGSSAVAAFAAQFFAAAGIESLILEGFETAQAAVDSFRASGCKIACLCVPVAIAPDNLIDFSVRLRDAGAIRICLAGREPDAASMVVLEVRNNELICANRDALAILEDLAAAVLQYPPS
jgi:methylmalonyl-CoA mutase